MTEAIRREDWFKPPEGILDGTDFDIALGWIEGMRADQAYMAEHPLFSDHDQVARSAAARVMIEQELDGYEQRLAEGDENLARLLTRRVEREVEELNKGERTTVTGQKHLLAERIKQVGHIWGVVIDDIPKR